MNLEMVATWVLVGLFTGWVAGMVIEVGGYGLIGDLILGLVGSSAAGGALWALGVSPEAGKFVTAAAAFVGAALIIVAQRKAYAHA